MGTTERTILSIDLLNNGEVIYKVFKNGQPMPIPEEDIKTAGVSFPIDLTPVKGNWEFNKTFSLKGISGSPLKVYVDTGDRVRCFLIESTTGDYLGPC